MLFVLDKQLSVEICAHYPALVAEVVLLPPLLFKCFEEEKKKSYGSALLKMKNRSQNPLARGKSGSHSCRDSFPRVTVTPSLEYHRL